jgi:two-component system sensor histidine kinase UhpB
MLFAAAYLGSYACSRYFAQRTGTRLWLPDSILLCTLLFVPKKKWWLYVLATAPVRFFPGLRVPAPAWILWANWINDVGKALLAAYLLKYATANSLLFKRVRHYATYLGVAVILAPLLSAFFGALVRLSLGHAFWPALGQWYLGDALANLVVTPALFLWLSLEYRSLRPRVFEAAAWALGFAICLGFGVWSRWINQSLIGLYAPFPFLIWAATRLGAIGASSGLTLTTLFVIGGLSQVKGPFYPIAHDMHFLQLFLAVLALPILFVATLFEERQAVEARLRENYERERHLTSRLINAQEDERKRIARELHDDISQRLALAAIEIDQLERGPDRNVTGSVRGPSQLIKEILEDTHGLSHSLHSRNLEYLGLKSALKELCQRLAKQHAVKIDVMADDFAFRLPDDRALCFFRVAQEALNNSVKHSGAAHIEVRLTTYDGKLRMKIRDDGQGFDPNISASGLGLSTMRERLKLVEGSLLVESEPGGGTEVTAEADLPHREAL